MKLKSFINDISIAKITEDTELKFVEKVTGKTFKAVRLDHELNFNFVEVVLEEIPQVEIRILGSLLRKYYKH